jgi:hypothetical protein
VDLKLFERAIVGGAKAVKVRFSETAIKLSAVVGR